MCATQNTPTPKPEQSSMPKKLNNQKRNEHSHGKKGNFTPKQSGSAQKPNHQSRNEKRARWAKKSRPAAKPIAKRGPAYEYTSACCNLPAQKPRCGQKETKMKDTAKGLGHWRCSGCRKVCKVTTRTPQPKVVSVDMTAVEQKVIAEVTNAPTV